MRFYTISCKKKMSKTVSTCQKPLVLGSKWKWGTILKKFQFQISKVSKFSVVANLNDVERVGCGAGDVLPPRRKRKCWEFQDQKWWFLCKEASFSNIQRANWPKFYEIWRFYENFRRFYVILWGVSKFMSFLWVLWVLWVVGTLDDKK